ncbi:MAG: hypothetical protein ACP5VQ_10575, partial [Phycisphaerae bacterium]
ARQLFRAALTGGFQHVLWYCEHLGYFPVDRAGGPVRNTTPATVRENCPSPIMPVLIGKLS